MSAEKYGNPRGRALSPMADPEAHATVMEFIDYTEYLHTDITRSLTLIQKLDRDYISCATTLDNLSQEYGTLKPFPKKQPEPPTYTPDNEQIMRMARTLREGMAKALNSAIKDREESVAEASRLYDNVDRHFNRLTDIIHKLQNVSIPARESSITDKGNATEDGGSNDTHMRITLRLDGQRNSISSATHADKHSLPRLSSTSSRYKTTPSNPSTLRHANGRQLKPDHINSLSVSSLVHIPNGNLQPQSPDSDSDWNDLPDPPPILSEADRVSTLSDYVNEEGERFPWFELLPAELAVLRKRMKKNSTWQPSEAMMLKQLESLGRGIRGFMKWAKRTNQSKAEVDQILGGGGKSGSGIFENALKNGRDNKGMKLNIMKRAKREKERREAAAVAAAEAAANGNMVKRDSISDEPIVVSEAGKRKDPIKFKGKRIAIPDAGAPLIGTKRKKSQSSKVSPTGTVKVNEHRIILPPIPPARHGPRMKNQTPSKPFKPKPVLKLTSRAFPPAESTNGGKAAGAGDDIVVRASSLEVDDDMPIDPNEPTYCICDKISYGVMVGCDNEECPKEWFHMECVGLKVKPSETMKWYCPLCRESLGVDQGGTSKKDSAIKLGKKRRKFLR